MTLRTVGDTPGCSGCPLQQKFPTNTFVAPALVRGATRAVIAEAPGKEEQVQGVPLVGGAGKVAASLYGKAGVRLADCTRLNVINCRPPNNDFPDSPEARAYCTKEEGLRAIHHCLREHVKPVLESQEWERVDLLGEKATRYVAGLEGGISRWRGSIVKVDTSKLG